jgi:hypothetical protein
MLQSIKAVNDNIARSPDSVDDSTIVTVACLANIEVQSPPLVKAIRVDKIQNLNSASSNAAIHIDGLAKMVALRGGLRGLGLKGIVRRMVLW